MMIFMKTCLGMIIVRRLGLVDKIKYLFMFVLYFSSDKEFQIFILSPLPLPPLADEALNIPGSCRVPE